MNDKFKILIIDDNRLFLNFLTKALSGIKDAEVVYATASGKVALSKLRQIEVDLVLLDIEMPEMDGIETLKEIKQKYPNINVVMMSGRYKSEADKVVKSLEIGAVDFISKEEIGEGDSSIGNYHLRVGVLIGMLRSRKNNLLTSTSLNKDPSKDIYSNKKGIEQEKIKELPICKFFSDTERGNRYKPVLSRIDVIAIASSTGGPNALKEIIPRLPGNLNVPVLLVQHMPPFLTASLTESLGTNASLKVKVAINGDEILPNNIYVAPGGKHMAVKCDGSINNFLSKRYVELNELPPENSVRPAADVLFRSISKSYNGNILAVILTGMGSDGTKGVSLMKKTGCYCLSQAKDTCIVYGMPRGVDDAGLSDEKVPLDKIAERIVKITNFV